MRADDWIPCIAKKVFGHFARGRSAEAEARARRRKRRTLLQERLEDRSVMYGGHGLEFNITPTASVPPQVKAAFQTAADQWSAILADDIVVNVTIDFTANSAGVGQALPASVVRSLADVRGALTSDQRSPTDATAVAHLPSGSSAALYTTDFHTGAPLFDDNGTDNNSALLLTRANAKALGLLPADSSASDGTIRFLSTVAYDYDPSNGIGAGRYDFVDVAMHEIGHLLGFVSGADAVDFKSKPTGPGYNAASDQDNQIVARPLDLFRQSAGAVAVGADFDLRADADPKYFSLDGGATPLAYFSTGVYHGDGRENQHWKDNLNIGLMDPSIALGEYGDLTRMDVQALDAIGWDPAMDYGDAPDAAAGAATDDYRTTLADDGPRHVLFSPTGAFTDPVGAPKVYLGTGVDRDLNGRPGPLADGDDAFDVDDETGVASFPPLVSGVAAEVPVTSSAAPARPARLDYFFDFNRNGVFNDPGEAFSVTLVGALQSVPVVVPANAAIGPTYARFRISTAGGLGPTGPADDGEVEDYRVDVAAPSPPIIAPATTLEDVLSAPIVIDCVPNQGVTHFRISGVSGGVLFRSDGVTPVLDGEFLTVAEGQAGVRFLPLADSTAPGSFDAESSQDGSTVPAQSGKTTAVIAITPVNDPPVGVVLSAASLDENLPAGAVVGTLTAVDPDAGDSFTWTLTSGSGDADNSRFTIDAAGQLRSAETFDFENRSSYAIRVRGTDSGGLAVEQAFVIAIVDVWESAATLSGTSGDDLFSVAYSTSGVQVTRTSNGGVATILGVYDPSMSLVVDGLGGKDRLTLVLSPGQIGALATSDILALNAYFAAPVGATLHVPIPGASDLTAAAFEATNATVRDDGGLLDVTACMAPITSDAQIQVGGDGIDDDLYGTNLPDLIFGQGGDDAIHGLGGNDCLVGGAGHDRLFGGDLDDLLLGGTGDDLLYGENGNDRLFGGFGADQLAGGANDDQLDGGAGADATYGGAGIDTLVVRADEAVDDVLNGGENSDKVVNDGSVPVVLAGFNAATNALEGWIGGNQPIVGTDASNVLNFQIGSSSAVKFSGVLYVDGRGGDDVITGTFGADDLRGGDGDDAVRGLGGVDVLYGDAGDDALDGGDGADYLLGGDGVDSLTTGAGADFVIFSGDTTSLDVVTDFGLNSDRIYFKGYGTNYAGLVFDWTTFPGSTIVALPSGKRVRLLNWNGPVAASQFIF